MAAGALHGADQLESGWRGGGAVRWDGARETGRLGSEVSGVVQAQKANGVTRSYGTGVLGCHRGWRLRAALACKELRGPLHPAGDSLASGHLCQVTQLGFRGGQTSSHSLDTHGPFAGPASAPARSFPQYNHSVEREQAGAPYPSG